MKKTTSPPAAAGSKHLGPDLDDLIVRGLKTPGIRIGRDQFLSKILVSVATPDTVRTAVATTPAAAGIAPAVTDRLANTVIQTERSCVTGISAALGIPGGFALAATVPADILQYYACLLRAAQKLMYLYGFPSVIIDGTRQAVSPETMNLLILCLGVMYDVRGSRSALRAVADALGSSVTQELLETALTKGIVAPVIRKVSRWFALHLARRTAAGVVKKAVPVIGGVISGGVTWISFTPCCRRLKKALQDTDLSNPAHHPDTEEASIRQAILTGNSGTCPKDPTGPAG